jgi:hypothetical protein
MFSALEWLLKKLGATNRYREESAKELAETPVAGCDGLF